MIGKNYFFKDRFFTIVLVATLALTSLVATYFAMYIAPRYGVIAEYYHIPGTGKYMKVFDSRRYVVIMVTDNLENINKWYGYIHESEVEKTTLVDFPLFTHTVQIVGDTHVKLDSWNGFKHPIILNDSLRLEPIAESIIPLEKK